jgi:hypothetical protein
MLNHKQVIFDNYAKSSYLATNSKQANDKSEFKIQNEILKIETNRFKQEKH